MRDLIFSNDSGSFKVTFRTDLVASGNKNFTIYQTFGLDPQDVTNNHAEKVMASFQRYRKVGGGPYNLDEMVQLATHYGFNLTSIDTSGKDAILLVDMGSGS